MYSVENRNEEIDMINYESIRYSIIHRDVVRLLAQKYINDKVFFKRIYFHDMDKVLLYMQESVGSAHYKHLENMPHHLESKLKKNDDDYRETIIDWDSARYTKPDKLLNAYQTLKKFYPDFYGEILPVLKELNLDSDDIPVDEEILNIVRLKNYDSNYCLEEIAEYVKYVINNNINLYYDIYEVLSNVYASLTRDEKNDFEKKLGDEIMNKVNTNKKVKVGVFTHRGCDYDAL